MGTFPRKSTSGRRDFQAFEGGNGVMFSRLAVGQCLDFRLVPGHFWAAAVQSGSVSEVPLGSKQKGLCQSKLGRPRGSEVIITAAACPSVPTTAGSLEGELAMFRAVQQPVTVQVFDTTCGAQLTASELCVIQHQAVGRAARMTSSGNAAT
eukprot:Skav234993  [mRNA]  locus=scaffold122:347982:351958:+ [translate_table: standard]